MTFLVDAQLPAGLARALTGAGHPSQHVAMVGLLNAEDDAIWDYAIANHMTVVTKDEDFVVRRYLEVSGPQIVWLRVGNCSNRELLTWFLPLFPNVVQRLHQNEILIELT